MKTKTHNNINSAKPQTKPGIRDRIDLLQGRAGLLSGKDRLLMTMYLKNANNFRQMARLAGVNEVTIARRIHKLIKRLIDGEYITCLRSRGKLTPIERVIAKDYLLRGLSQKKIAKKRGCSLYSVRETLKKIQQMITLPEAD